MSLPLFFLATRSVDRSKTIQKSPRCSTSSKVGEEGTKKNGKTPYGTGRHWLSYMNSKESCGATNLLPPSYLSIVGWKRATGCGRSRTVMRTSFAMSITKLKRRLYENNRQSYSWIRPALVPVFLSWTLAMCFSTQCYVCSLWEVMKSS